MKLYTSSQIVRAVLFSVAGTAVLACAIFFYRENKNQISNTTQIEYNEETVNIKPVPIYLTNAVKKHIIKDNFCRTAANFLTL